MERFVKSHFQEEVRATKDPIPLPARNGALQSPYLPSEQGIGEQISDGMLAEWGRMSRGYPSTPTPHSQNAPFTRSGGPQKDTLPRVNEPPSEKFSSEIANGRSGSRKPEFITPASVFLEKAGLGDAEHICIFIRMSGVAEL